MSATVEQIPAETPVENIQQEAVAEQPAAVETTPVETVAEQTAPETVAEAMPEAPATPEPEVVKDATANSASPKKRSSTRIIRAVERALSSLTPTKLKKSSPTKEGEAAQAENAKTEEIPKTEEVSKAEDAPAEQKTVEEVVEQAAAAVQETNDEAPANVEANTEKVVQEVDEVAAIIEQTKEVAAEAAEKAAEQAEVKAQETVDATTAAIDKAIEATKVAEAEAVAAVTEGMAEVKTEQVKATLSMSSKVKSAFTKLMPSPSKTKLAEVPVTEAPVAEAPVAETPVAEAPVAEASKTEEAPKEGAVKVEVAEKKDEAAAPKPAATFGPFSKILMMFGGCFAAKDVVVKQAAAKAPEAEEDLKKIPVPEATAEDAPEKPSETVQTAIIDAASDNTAAPAAPVPMTKEQTPVAAVEAPATAIAAQ